MAGEHLGNCPMVRSGTSSKCRILSFHKSKARGAVTRWGALARYTHEELSIDKGIGKPKIESSVMIERLDVIVEKQHIAALVMTTG